MKRKWILVVVLLLVVAAIVGFVEWQSWRRNLAQARIDQNCGIYDGIYIPGSSGLPLWLESRVPENLQKHFLKFYPINIIVGMTHDSSRPIPSLLHDLKTHYPCGAHFVSFGTENRDEDWSQFDWSPLAQWKVSQVSLSYSASLQLHRMPVCPSVTSVELYFDDWNDDRLVLVCQRVFPSLTTIEFYGINEEYTECMRLDLTPLATVDEGIRLEFFDLDSLVLPPNFQGRLSTWDCRISPTLARQLRERSRQFPSFTWDVWRCQIGNTNDAKPEAPEEISEASEPNAEE